MPVRALLASSALALNPEGADVRTVALVVRRGAGQPRERLVLLSGDVAERATGRNSPVRLSKLTVSLL